MKQSLFFAYLAFNTPLKMRKPCVNKKNQSFGIKRSYIGHPGPPVYY